MNRRTLFSLLLAPFVARLLPKKRRLHNIAYGPSRALKVWVNGVEQSPASYRFDSKNSTVTFV